MEKEMTRLRKIRMGSGISMTDLALKADVAPSTLSLIERGKRPSLRTATRIAEALNVDVALLWENHCNLRSY